MLTKELKNKIIKAYIPLIFFGTFVFSFILLPGILDYYIWYIAIILAIFRSFILTFFFFSIALIVEIIEIRAINKKLQMEPFKIFIDQGFKINDIIYLEGWVNKYFCRITLKNNYSKRKITYIYLYIYYFENNKLTLEQRQQLSRKNNFYWDFGHIVKTIKSNPKKLPKYDTIKNHIVSITNLLNHYGFGPISFDDWFSTYGIAKQEAEDQIIENRTKFRLNLFNGKLDFRILKK